MKYGDEDSEWKLSPVRPASYLRVVASVLNPIPQGQVRTRGTVGGMATAQFRAKGLMRVNRFVIHS